jgi:uracil-DNA glycosylase
MTPVHKKKSENPQEEVMRVKESLKQQLAANNIQPQIIVNLGRLAFAAIKDKALYPMVIQQAKQLGLIGNNKHLGYDYKVLSTLVVTGKLAEMIIKEVGNG